MRMDSAPTSFSTRLNDIVNVVILVAVIVIGVRLVRGTAPSQSMGYRVGDTASALPASLIAGASRTLVLQVRSTCPYCAQAAPFLRRVTGRLRTPRSGLRIVAVTTEPLATCREYLQRNEIAFDDLASVGTTGSKLGITPAILLVDGNRRVVGAWLGLLSAAQEREVEHSAGLQ